LVGEEGSPDGRRGTVRFVGPIEELPGGGLWIGVECDEPVGKNDGTVKGRRVFEQVGQGGKRGLFVRPERVKTGDYPPLEDLDAEMGDEEEI
jgi:tubulin-folding cofactor B